MDEKMDKESILKAAQNANAQGKEFENREGVKSNLVGLLASLCVGVLLFLVEYLVKKTWNIALIAVFMTAAGTQMLYEGIKLKSVWRIVTGSIQLLVAAFFTLGFIGQVIS